MDSIVIITIAYIVMVTATLTIIALTVLKKDSGKKDSRSDADDLTELTASMMKSVPESETDTDAPADENTVSFSAAPQTLDEKYLALKPDAKGYYDKIVCYANMVEGAKRYKKTNSEEYKVGQNRIVRLKIKNNVVVCELFIPNSEFKIYMENSKVETKQAPTIIRVIDETRLEAVKNSIDIIVNAIKEERMQKKEYAKIKRKERRAMKEAQ